MFTDLVTLFYQAYFFGPPYIVAYIERYYYIALLNAYGTLTSINQTRSVDISNNVCFTR